MPNIIYRKYEDFDPGKLKRGETIQKDYEGFLQWLNTVGGTPTECIYQTVFELPNLGNAIRLDLRKNEFPLDLPDDQTHMLLWCRDDTITDDEAFNYIMATYKRENVVCIYSNETAKQSVKGIKHYHIILEV